jgi:hypothetical protein
VEEPIERPSKAEVKKLFDKKGLSRRQAGYDDTGTRQTAYGPRKRM